MMPVRNGLRLITLSLALSLGACHVTEAQPSPLWGGLEKGDYDVGFKAIRLSDHSRPYRQKYDSLGNVVEDRARPIRLFVWYPASHEPADTALSYGEYICLEDFPSDPWQHSAEQRQRGMDKAVEQSIDTAQMPRIWDALVKAKTAAVREAEMASGSFPLLLFGSGGTTPGYMYSVLCEYLASHSYIAVTLPALGPVEDERWPFDQVGIGLKMQDLAFVLNYMYTVPGVDSHKLGLVSWSVSGVSQALLQMQNTDVDVLVSLDGATGYLYGTQMIRESIYYDSAAVTVPYFHAHGKAPAQYEVVKDFTHFDSLASSDAYLLSFEHLDHATFRSQSVIEHLLMKTERAPLVVADYDFLSQAVLAFLDAYLKKIWGAEDQLMQIGEHPSVTVLRKP